MLEYVPGTDRVYCAGSEYWSNHRSVMYVLDVAGRNVAGTVSCLMPPTDILAVPEANRLYVSYHGTYMSTLQIVDIPGDSVVKMLPTGNEATALAWNPDYRKLYQSTEDGVYIIDPAGDSIMGLVAIRARRLLYSGVTGRLYVTNGVCALRVVDGATDSVIAEVGSGGQGAGAMFMDPESLRLYCANWETGNIGVIDARRNVRIGAIQSGRGPSAFACDPVRRRLYCANPGNWSGSDSTVIVIDMDDASLLATIPVGRRPVQIAYDPARQYVWCALQDDSSVAVIDCRTLSVRGHLGLGVAATDLAVMPQDNEVYVAGPGLSAVLILQDTVPAGVAEIRAVRIRPPGFPSIARAVLYMPESAIRHSTFALLNCVGRKVMDLQPGENDVRHVSPGIYFVRREDSRDTRKVILTR
jgi:YVTN family beta-propeller protein